MIRERMGHLLCEAGFISERQLACALEMQRGTGRRLGQILLEQGLIAEETLLAFLGQQYGVPVFREWRQPTAPDELTRLIPEDLARKECLVPIQRTGDRLTVAMANPANVGLTNELAFRTGCRIIPVVALESEIIEHIHRLYAPSQSTGEKNQEGKPRRSPANQVDSQTPTPSWEARGDKDDHKAFHGIAAGLASDEIGTLVEQVTTSLQGYGQPAEDERHPEDSAPLVTLVNRLLSEAIRLGASDMHLEPYEACVRVRYRVDGVLHPVMTYPVKLRNAVVSRLKILANLDIAERRLPQDGRFCFKGPAGTEVDVRMSVLPCLHGEKVVLRFLHQTGLSMDLAQLGFEPDELPLFLEALERPEGMIVVTGPTGSGKTTTLYSALHLLNTPDVNIVTAEDPIEYHITGVTQVQIHEDIGLTFSAALRAFLRQDPDILMIGEIRDHETAHMAVRAALTGHRVLSTLHTTDAVRTIARLLDMGIESFLVASAVSLIVAQRLVRRICPFCREPDPLPKDHLVKLGFSPEEANVVIPMRGAGCPSCYQTGYKGRIALFEVLPLTETLQARITQHPSLEELRCCTRQMGVRTLRHSGLRKIHSGLTTIQEVIGATAGTVIS
ncbi:MAG: type II secretion system protein GspE [Nitrospirae bacterium]|nr:MAG: type II secretion system protein GspE [Nitrospirota bacterium]